MLQKTKSGVINHCYINSSFYNCSCIHLYLHRVIASSAFIPTEGTLQHFLKGELWLQTPSAHVFIETPSVLPHSPKMVLLHRGCLVDRWFSLFSCHSTYISLLPLASKDPDKMSGVHLTEEASHVRSAHLLLLPRLCLARV